MIIIVDDAHWLDIETVNALAFVGRRIEDESIGLLLGARCGESFEMGRVPQLRLGGVDLAAARHWSAAPATTWHRKWSARCVHAVAGNPLALLELPGVLDADQRAGRRPLDDPLTVTASVERAFLTRIDRLDADGRQALLLAAASDSDDVETIRRAAPAAATGLEHAERIGLVRVQRGRIGFWHPLVRSAVYAAATDEERRAAHRALADGLSQAHPARRAWHLVAADGAPDDDVSGDLADAESRRAVMAPALAPQGCLTGPPQSLPAGTCAPGGCSSRGKLPGPPGS